MFCSNCGNEVKKEDKFCSKCGCCLDKGSIETKKDTNDKTKNPKIILDYFIIFGRWAFAIPFFVASIGVLTEGAILSALFLALCSIIITPIKIPNLTGKNRFIVGFSSFLLAGFILVITTEDNTNQSSDNVKNQIVEQNKKQEIETKQNDNENMQNIDKKQDSAMLSSEKLPALPKKIDVKIDDTNNKVNASYDPKILDIIPTQKGKGWDKVLKEYGVDGVKKINALLPQAAELMSKNSSCDKLYYVAYSSRGNPKNIVIFGNCNNGAQVFLSEKEIAAKQVPLTKKEKLKKMELSLMNACDEIVKSRLTHPSTFDKSIFRSRVSTDEYKTTVLVGFTAKNSFNLKLKYNAICIFNDKPELVSFSLEEDK